MVERLINFQRSSRGWVAIGDRYRFGIVKSIHGGKCFFLGRVKEHHNLFRWRLGMFSNRYRVDTRLGWRFLDFSRPTEYARMRPREV